MPVYSDFYKGVSPSKKFQNKFDEMVNCEIHSELGSLQCQKALEKKSGTLITAGCYRAVAPNGDVYFFSKSDGKIWKRAIADGAYTLVRTGGNGAFKGAAYYRNFIYYSMDGFLGRYAFGDIALGAVTMTIATPAVLTKTTHGLYLGESVSFTTTGALPTGLVAGTTYYAIPIDANTFNVATSYANAIAGTKIATSGSQSGTHTLYRVSWNDNFQTLTTSVAHPIHQFDLIMYVGNGKDVASMDDSGTWSSSVLDLPVEYQISALQPYGDDLLTLANPGNYIVDSGIFRWNSYSDSWSLKDSIKEINAYAFLDADNYVHVICQNGNIYTYDGAKLHLISNIRNAKTTYGHQLTTNLEGRPLVANGGRIYSLYKRTKDMPLAFAGEYTCSAGDTATIHSIVALGSNLLVSWELAGAFGIDEISTSHAVAQVVTPRFKKAGIVKVSYDTLNGGTIGIESKLDGESSWTTHTEFDDSEDTRSVMNEDTILVESGAQARITITPSVSAPTTTPVIDKIEITN